MKKILGLTSILGIVAALGACSSSSTETKKQEVRHTQTRVDEDVTKVRAKMHETRGEQESMGELEFKETDRGLRLSVDLYNLRPGITYRLRSYDLSGERRDLNLPRVKPDEKGKATGTYLALSTTAAELKNTKITLHRDDANGNEIQVGMGVLK